MKTLLDVLRCISCSGGIAMLAFHAGDCGAGEVRMLTPAEIAGLAAAHEDPLPGLAAAVEYLVRYELRAPISPEQESIVPLWMRSPASNDPADTDYEAWGRILNENKESLRAAVGLPSDLEEIPAGRALHKLATPAAKAQADKVAALLEFTKSWDVCLSAAETLGHMRAAEYAPVIAEIAKTSRHWGVTRLMRVLEQMQGRECTGLLVSLLDGPVFNNDTHKEIMLILEGFGDPRCAEAAIAYLGYCGTRDRADALRVLRKFGNPGLAPRLLRLLERGSSGVRNGFELTAEDQGYFESQDAFVRAQAIEALEALGCREEKPAIIRMLDAAQPIHVRLQAMKALSALGSPEYAEQVASMLTKSVPDQQRREVLSTLTAMNWKAKVPEVTALLTPDEHMEIRIHALSAIGGLATRGNASWRTPFVGLIGSDKAKADLEVLGILRESGTLQRIVDQLKDGDTRVQAATLWTLTDLGYDGPVDPMLILLHSKKADVQIAAIQLLAPAANPSVSAAIAGLLPSADGTVLSAALWALVERKATEHTGAVAAQFRKEGQSHNPGILQTLIALKAVDQTEHVAAFLNDDDSELRSSAIHFMSALKIRDRMPEVAAHVLDGGRVHFAAREALLEMRGELSPTLLAFSLEAAALFPDERAAIMAEAYLLYGGVKELRTVLPWLGNRAKAERPELPVDAPAARGVIEALSRLRRDAAALDLPRTVWEAGIVIAQIAAAAHWSYHDAGWLETLATDLGSRSDFKQESALVQALAEEMTAQHPRRRALRIAAWTLLIQPLVWALVSLVYPWSALAQWLVWTRWVRRLLGFGWVGPVVLRGLWLRERMWLPFREALVPPGETVSFDEWTFFDAVRVSPVHGGEAQPALRVLEAQRGVTVLYGVSGLGKTTLLQSLAGRSSRPVALLRAAECGAGLLEALRLRLPHQARGDGAFLRALAVRGSPDILVDAVHEALPEVRAKLSAEIESLPGANILLTTQPAEWTPPAGAAEWQLEPLRTQDIAPFLLKQGTAAAEAAGARSLAERQRAFAARTAAFLDELEKLPPESERAVSLRRMLGNPMEAVLAAELLAAGQTPDPDLLLEQRMEHLTEDYTAEQGGEFPAAAFADHLRSWRASGAPMLRLDRFTGVASFLARHRLLRKMTGGVEAWRFRHDKIMEWFLRVPATDVNSGQQD